MAVPAFDLAVCPEMVFLDLPPVERVERIHDLSFAVEIWDHRTRDIDALARTGTRIESMTGYLEGGLIDKAGDDAYVRTAQACIDVAERLGCQLLNLHGTALDDRGLPVGSITEVTGPMWRAAARTLERLGALGERHSVTFCLENVNAAVDHPGVPFGRAADTLALIETVDHPSVRMNVDLYHAQIGEGNFAEPGSTTSGRLADARLPTAEGPLRGTEYLMELVRRPQPVVGEIQVADVPGRCEPGTGEINCPAIRDALWSWATTARSASRRGRPATR
ncbi:MAG TPA: TIM barrel protein [Euzebyales bacterium]|nr:TIM barrel protein [Euzebyales bacterium]